MRFASWARRTHRWGAVIALLPLGVVIATGLLLQLKKEIPWVQPPTMKGRSSVPRLSFEQQLEIARTFHHVSVRSWDDVERIDVQPGKGVVKLQAKSRWEIQLDAETGDVLHIAYRRSGIIESLHDGSWFHIKARLGLFLPAAVVLACLWLTGLYLFLLPYWVRARRRRRTEGRLSLQSESEVNESLAPLLSCSLPGKRSTPGRSGTLPGFQVRS